MEEIDAFARVIGDFGPPENAKSVPPDVIELYKDYLPPSMIRFWETYGWGNYKSGYCRICDPRPFQPLVKSMFTNDPDFDHQDLTVIMFTALCEMDIWSRKGYGIYVNLANSRVNSQSKIVNPSTGKKYNKDFLIGSKIHGRISNGGMQDYYSEAVERLGKLKLDEVFGFVPALQLGGDPFPENLQRFKAMEYLDFLAQIEPLTLIEITDPEPGAPLGRMKDVRRIGSQ
ncbi:hypothetical protein SAMN02799622_05346 [Methylobacterium sp. UNC378MF]|uniref:GAD-like domain-containing protein n=1 Tax=Methylobacterium sp. UNC378MF TaxID=1502748 RepID=UPI000892462B|nr:GAD-like domain-containing protein [Methylobacterium sp. UNC378MF]SDA32878.1 hypothetical protein SAMN02799622_05346 [Methylobacterium sp. UNC378MF]